MTYSEQARPTVAEIDGGALAANFAELVRVAGGGVIAVVKSDAYGHGLALATRALVRAGAERFAVATCDEGETLRRAADVRGPVLVLGGVYPAEHARAIAADLTPVVWDVEAARGLAAAARAAGRVVSVHVKVDTGMSRLGVAPGEAPALLAALARLPGLAVEGLLTHLVDAETAGSPYVARQLALFDALVRELAHAGLRPPLVHAANSAATLARDGRFDVVRPGLALYGVYPAAAARGVARLVPVMRLVTRVVALRTIAPGTAVSYGATFVAARPSRIATLPVGYADGYPRALSNCGEVLVRGRRVAVAGRVCMDQTMIDVSEVPGVAVGDEVELWGRGLPVEDVATRAGTIPYELLARVGPRVPRVAV